MRKHVILIIILGISLLGCEDALKQKVKSWLDISDGRVVELENKVNTLEKECNNLNTEIFKLRLDKQEGREISLDTSELGKFQLLHTDVGDFLISLNDVKPYLNGHKLFLLIGNPFNADFKNIKLKASWAPCEGEGEDFKFKQKETSFIEPLKRGTWNKVQLILVPSQPKDLCFLYLSMDTEGCIISLYTK